MGKKIWTVILLAMAFFVVSRAAVDVKSRDRKIHTQVLKKLKLLNKPPIKTIHSRDGDIIDCIDIYKQPAFDHPALKNHKIEMEPSFHIAPKNESSSPQTWFQTWQKSGSCPKGTIPIRRIRKEDLLRATSLDNFGKKYPNTSSSLKLHQNGSVVPMEQINVTLGPEINRSTAILATAGFNYIGASGDINLPNVESVDDFTAAEIWLKNGPSESFESVESGWTVNPKLYGDKRSRFSVYWTVDSYKSTGCFDLTCSGFIHTNPNVALGAALEPWSGRGGPQYLLSVGIFMETTTGNWWLRVGGNIAVGYWPATLFGGLRHSAILVEWGGEVYSSRLKKSPHTATAMGSGGFASGLYGNACFIKKVRIMDYSLQLKYPLKVGTYADEPYCYSAYNFQEGYVTEPVFYFGGPGRNPNCP